MKSDFSRDTFDVTKHFTRVLMQQGRVQLDADWNEQEAVMVHYLQAPAADLFGSSGGPKANLGVELGLITADGASPKIKDLSIGADVITSTASYVKMRCLRPPALLTISPPRRPKPS
jgi:hypothetical protein